jgi:hypothetical protein
MATDLLALLKAHPNCRISFNGRPASSKPKPQEGELKLRGTNWWRYDYQRAACGATIVNRKGHRKWGWVYDREATQAEILAARKAKKG